MTLAKSRRRGVQARGERDQDARDDRAGRLEEIDEGVRLLDPVHHVHDEARARVRLPRGRILAPVERGDDAHEGRVVHDVPGVQVVACPWTPEHPAAPPRCKRSPAPSMAIPDAAARGGIAAVEAREELILDVGQGQLDVVVAEDEHEQPPVGVDEAGEGAPHGLEGRILEDGGELLAGALRVEVSRALVGQEVDDVAVEHQADAALVPPGKVVDDRRQRRALVEATMPQGPSEEWRSETTWSWCSVIQARIPGAAAAEKQRRGAGVYHPGAAPGSASASGRVGCAAEPASNRGEGAGA